jgi:hypothetical protein
MLVIVFNDGTEHKIKNCDSYQMPGCGFFGAIESNGKKIGTIYNKSNISFCYFDKE